MYYTFAIKARVDDEEMLPQEIVAADTEQEAREKLVASLEYRLGEKLSPVWYIDLISSGETNGNPNQPTL